MSSDARNEGWLQSNWRPLAMLVFVALIACDAAGALDEPLSNRAWDFFELLMGGYIAARSMEKVSTTFRKPQ